MDDRRHVETLEVGDEAGDELGVVRLLDEVELGEKMRFELVGERTELERASVSECPSRSATSVAAGRGRAGPARRRPVCAP
jgi:hypothetical protein